MFCFFFFTKHIRNHTGIKPVLNGLIPRKLRFVPLYSLIFINFVNIGTLLVTRTAYELK